VEFCNRQSAISNLQSKICNQKSTIMRAIPVKAAVFDRFGEPAEVLQVRDVPVPEPGRNEVRVRMLASPVNPSDLMTVRGVYGRLPQLPATPGFEGVGVIDATGPGFLKILRGLKAGKKVAVLNSQGGNWQEYVIIPARNVVPVGDLEDAQAATFFVNPASAYIMTRKVLAVPRGEWLLQTAAGSALGEMVRRLGRKHGFRVLNVVRREEQAEQLRQAGHTAVSTQQDDFEAGVRDITGGGVKYAIDAVGGDTASRVARCLAPRGKMLLYGTLSGEAITFDPRVLMAGQASIEGFWLSEWVKEQGIFTMLGLFRKIVSLMKEGVIATEVQELSLDNIQEAARQAEAVGRGKKVLLRIGH
jgi:NADPH2:quinone reductase